MDFADLLTTSGRRIMEGRDRTVGGALADPAQRFLSLGGILIPERAEKLMGSLDRHVFETLPEVSHPIPENALREARKNYAEMLPKTMRWKTSLMQNMRSRSALAAKRAGVVDLLKSESFFRFAEALAGRPLRKSWGIQVSCYRHGDYSGPHTDHHPEDKRARGGYVDIHVSLANDAVAHQYLVYENDGHFSESVLVSTLGDITAYRLPFWHYTTPLVAKPGRETEARRWLLLGTFLYA
jgi:hypothetical protein